MKKRKWLAIAVCIIMLLGMMPTTVFAENMVENSQSAEPTAVAQPAEAEPTTPEEPTAEPQTQAGEENPTSTPVTTLSESEAAIGETEYETLAEAVAAAQAGNTIKLLKDVTLSQTVTITQNITIDGDRHSITSNGTPATMFQIPGEAELDGVVIQNCTFVTPTESRNNNTWIAIYVQGKSVKNLTITYNTFQIRALSQNSSFQCIGLAEDKGFKNPRYTNNIKITHNKVMDTHKEEDNAFFVVAAVGNTGENNTDYSTENLSITDNELNGQGSNKQLVGASVANVKDLTMTGNTFLYCYAGLYLLTGTNSKQQVTKANDLTDILTGNDDRGTSKYVLAFAGTAPLLKEDAPITLQDVAYDRVGLTKSAESTLVKMSFNANGGTFGVDLNNSDRKITDITYVAFKNTSLTLPAPPTREGYIFKGWKTDDNGLSIGSNIESYDVSETSTNRQLKAQWEESEEKPETVRIVIYRNGNTKEPYKTVNLESKKTGEKINLSELKIRNYYEAQGSAQEYDFYGWYNDGQWNQYKQNPANPPAALGTLTVNGWTNINCMVYDYEKVVVKALYDSSTNIQNAEILGQTTARRGAKVLDVLNELGITLDKTGYTHTEWYKDNLAYKFTEQDTINGWTNAYVKYNRKSYTVTAKMYLDGKPHYYQNKDFYTYRTKGRYGDTIGYDVIKQQAIEQAKLDRKASASYEAEIVEDNPNNLVCTTFGQHQPDQNTHYVKVDVRTMQHVKVYAEVDGVRETTPIWTGTAAFGTKVTEFLNSIERNFDREGYTSDKWYKGDATQWKFAEEDTINGWTNAVIKYTTASTPTPPTDAPHPLYVKVKIHTASAEKVYDGTALTKPELMDTGIDATLVYSNHTEKKLKVELGRDVDNFYYADLYLGDDDATKDDHDSYAILKLKVTGSQTEVGSSKNTYVEEDKLIVGNKLTGLTEGGKTFYVQYDDSTLGTLKVTEKTGTGTVTPGGTYYPSTPTTYPLTINKVVTGLESIPADYAVTVDIKNASGVTVKTVTLKANAETEVDLPYGTYTLTETATPVEGYTSTQNFSKSSVTLNSYLGDTVTITNTYTKVKEEPATDKPDKPTKPSKQDKPDKTKPAKANDNSNNVPKTGDDLPISLAIYGIIAAGALLGIRKAAKRTAK